MTKPTQLGRLERVPLRAAWKHEASDFTPWLAQPDNLSLLAEALGIEGLEAVAIEQQSGDFKIDILCTGGNSQVIIENQLGKTDHTHLGQIITYAAGAGAKKIIWIAESFRPEHISAIDFLNENTTDDLNFFAVEIKLWKIGDSPLAPKFEVVAKPNEWTKARREQARAAAIESPTKKKQYDFWTEFSEKLQELAPHIKCETPQPRHWLRTSTGRAHFNINLNINTREERLGVELFITGERAKKHFSQLQKHRAEIESNLGFALEWQELPDAKSVRIATWYYDAPIEARDRWPKYIEWLSQRLIKMHETIIPIIRSIPSRETDAEPKS